MFNVTDPEAPPPDKPVPAVTFVISPTFVVNPTSLLNIDNPISLAAFLLSAPASKTTNSSVPTIVAVISVNSDKSTAREIVPEEVTVPPPDKPVPAVTPTEVTVPVFVVNPESLLNPEILILPFVNFF